MQMPFHLILPSSYLAQQWHTIQNEMEPVTWKGHNPPGSLGLSVVSGSSVLVAQVRLSVPGPKDQETVRNADLDLPM